MDIIKLFHYTFDDNLLKELARKIKKARKIKCVGEINSEVPCLQLKYALAMYGIDSDVLSSSSHIKANDLIVNENDLLIVMSARAKSSIVKKALELKESNHCWMLFLYLLFL